MTTWYSNVRLGRSSIPACAAAFGLAAGLAWAQPDSIVTAAANGDQAQVSALLARGVDVNTRDARHQTALLMAASGAASEYRVIGANASMVRFLVEHQADVNARDNEGWHVKS